MKSKFNLLIHVLILSVIPYGCSSDDTLFERLPVSETGVTFSNRINPNDTLNIITTEYIYNGGGVGLADFNNDGLLDIFFSGNQVGNELYLNKGDFKFQNISTQAGINSVNRWSSGVSVVDINADGLMDIYVSATIYKTPEERSNLLYINKGVTDGVPVFEEMAEAYGVADKGHGEHAAFFDYDNDGDLDLYVLIDVIDQYPNQFRKKVSDGSYPNTDKLYRNDYSEELSHAVFTDVSSEAGITMEGYGLGLTICDINQDGWKDIYVTNDYAADDLLYINNKNGTFSDQAHSYFKHSSNSAMGNDVADINNDGLPDIVALDMQPATNLRKKLLAAPNNYFVYQFTEKFDYTHQYMRNTLQLNSGSYGDGIQPPFTEIGLLAGVSETDWSWCPSLADFDNDGYRDLLITNGFPKDVTDRDFMAFRQGINNIASAEFLMTKIPEVKISNYAFRNTGSLTFEDKTEAWGLEVPSFSNGAAYGDLDNDGDLDYVVNNINDSAFVYRNTARDIPSENANFLRIEFKGNTPNLFGYGAVVKGKYGDGQLFYAENIPTRGYLSSIEPAVHIGLGSQKIMSELIIVWGNGKSQRFSNVKANQVLTVNQSDALDDYDFTQAPKKTLFDALPLTFLHQERDFVDYNLQSLMPQKLSQLGPSLAVGDVNGDKLEDIYVSGSKFKSGSLLLRQAGGGYAEKLLQQLPDTTKKLNEEIGSVFFDADGDGDLDLYIVNGGNEGKPDAEFYQDQLFVNDGKGNFSLNKTALPAFYTAGSCVRASDFDNDGDLDLFVGGRNAPFNYPKAVSSTLLRNDSKKGVAKFVDVTKEKLPALIGIGLTCDALWTDIDNDGDNDLMIVREFAPITVFINEKGSFSELKSTGLENYFGMWNSVNGGDFDGDGDIDYIVGNVGLNARFKGTEKYPAKILAGDFDNNGNYDAIPFIYLPKSNEDKKLVLAPYNAKDDMSKQLPMMQGRYNTFTAYADATFDNILDEDKRSIATEFTLNYNASVYVENLGNGKLKIKALPTYAQFAPINGTVIEDFNNDGNLDVLLVGNNFGNELLVGRYDALNGLLLSGDGKGNFTAKLNAGFNVIGDAKALVKIVEPSGEVKVMASQNRGEAKLFSTSVTGKVVDVTSTTTRVVYELNGKKYVREIYYGSSYLSQSSRRLILPESAKNIVLK
jgi:hypothetical protein